MNIHPLTLCFLLFSGSCLAAGGIAILAPRIVYPQNAGQQTISVLISSSTDSFLIQSWVETADGKKSEDFVVTPPLYLSGPKNENTLRVLHMTPRQVKDRESVYYFIVKSIPSTSNGENSAGTFKVAMASRIKLFLRPEGLAPDSDKAPRCLTFSEKNKTLKIKNPTPYYITLTNIKYGSEKIKDMMVAPKESVIRPVLKAGAGAVSFSTINDSGAIIQQRAASVSILNQ